MRAQVVPRGNVVWAMLRQQIAGDERSKYLGIDARVDGHEAAETVESQCADHGYGGLTLSRARELRPLSLWVTRCHRREPRTRHGESVATP